MESQFSDMEWYLLRLVLVLNKFLVVVTYSTVIDALSSDQSTTNVYCKESVTLIGNRNITWNRTPISSPAYPYEYCADKSGTIPHRDCTGDYNSSTGNWSEVIGDCSGNFSTSNLTNKLHRMMRDYLIDGFFDYASLAEISFEFNGWECVDLYFLSQGLYYMTIEENLPSLLEHFEGTMDNTLEIFSKFKGKCPKVFDPSCYILGAVNVFFNRVTEEHNEKKKIVKPNFVFQISNPFYENVIGLSLYKRKDVVDDSFENYTIKEILLDESYEDIATENLQLAGYVPNELIKTLSKTLNDEEKSLFKIIIVALRDTTLFDLDDDTSIISEIIGLSISGYCNQNKEGRLFDIYSKPLTPLNDGAKGDWFTVNNNDMYSKNVVKKCEYPPVSYIFLYDKEEKGNQSCQKTDQYLYAELIVQESESSSLKVHNQTTNFDILSSLSMSINYAQPQTVVEAIYKRHHFVLKTLMLTGCTLSLFGLLATALTLIFIKKWHKKRMYSIQLQVAMGFETLLFLIDSDISYVTYIVLYYFILSQFSWMMLIGYTQYLKFVKVFTNSSSNMIKSMLIGWITPALIILIPIAVYPDCLYCEHCSAKRNILIYFVIIPTSVIILINISIYLKVMMSISNSKGQEYGANISKKRTRVGILLPFMLGITWVFVFALVSPWSWFSLIGSYLFHLIAPVQAFVLFIFVVVLDKRTRFNWMGQCTTWKNKLSTNSDSSASTNKPFTIS